MISFLRRKNVSLSPKIYFVDALGAMAFGLFATLLVGTILNSIGTSLNIKFLSETIWPLAKEATGPAIAVSIAYALGAPNLVIFASTIVGPIKFARKTPTRTVTTGVITISIFVSFDTILPNSTANKVAM